MAAFKDFGIKPAVKKLTGDKVDIDRILNTEITVCDFSIEDSKYKEKYDKCLYMQIEYRSEKRVVFSGSRVLMDMILQVPATNFPFTTTIVKVNKHFEFT
mgnify:FL=1